MSDRYVTYAPSGEPGVRTDDLATVRWAYGITGGRVVDTVLGIELDMTETNA